MKKLLRVTSALCANSRANWAMQANTQMRRKKLRKFYAKVAYKMSNFCKKRPIFASEICPVLRIVCASFRKNYNYQNCRIRRQICTELCENSHPTLLNLNCWKDCSLNFNRLFIYRMLCPIENGPFKPLSQQKWLIYHILSILKLIIAVFFKRDLRQQRRRIIVIIQHFSDRKITMFFVVVVQIKIYIVLLLIIHSLNKGSFEFAVP